MHHQKQQCNSEKDIGPKITPKFIKQANPTTYTCEYKTESNCKTYSAQPNCELLQDNGQWQISVNNYRTLILGMITTQAEMIWSSSGTRKQQKYSTSKTKHRDRCYICT